MTTTLLIGTRKGLFIGERANAEAAWSFSEPLCEWWPINHAIYDASRGRILAAGGNQWFGPAVWWSDDGGKTWAHSSDGIGFGEGAPAVTAAWALAQGPDGTLYLGTDPAGLFRSTDGGEHWEHMAGLRNHGSAERWIPGGGGLILHTIIPTAEHLYVAISVAGVYRSDDGGETWSLSNKGIPEPEEGIGVCAHHVELAADGKRLYQQNHTGTFRSDDGAESWQNIGGALPSDFGFAIAAHPSDADTCFAIPLSADIGGRYMPGGRAQVWRTQDGGATWGSLSKGLPEEPAYFGVLRLAMATDRGTPAGVYFGTSDGQVFGSQDGGDRWERVVGQLPYVHSVYAYQR